MVEITLEQALTQGVAAQQEGRLQDAERLFKAILRARPDHADANHRLGLLAASVGKYDVASRFFKAAINADSDSQTYWINYVEALIEQGQISEAKQAIAVCASRGIAPKRMETLEAHVQSLSRGRPLSIKDQRKKRSQAKKRKIQGRQRNRGEGPTDQEINNLLSLYQNNQLNDAERLARSLSTTFPRHPFAWKILGAALKQSGKLEEACIAMKRSVQLAPSDAANHNNLGITLLELGMPEEAERSCRKAIELRSNYPEAFFNLGLVLQNSDKFNDAEKIYKQAVLLKSDYAQAYYNLGVTQQILEKLVDAEESYRSAIALKPDYAEAHNNIGVIRQRTGSLEDAVQSYESAIAADDQYPEAHNNLGTALKELGNLEEAESNYRKAISLDANYFECLNNLGVVFQELGRYNEAEESYKRALDLNPDYVESHINLGNTLHQAANYEKAVASYTNALSLDGSDSETHSYMGASLRELGKLNEAKASYLKSIDLKPRDAEAHNNLGVILQELGEIDQAERSYEDAISIKPDFAESHRHLAAIKKYSHKDGQFLKMESLALNDELAPEKRCHIHFGLAKAHEDIGDVKQAFEHYCHGNALRRNRLNYDNRRNLSLFDQIKRAHSQIAKFSIENTSSEANPIPIFIVGMPRSGTTLVEQIISAHPLVTGGGELPFVTQLGASLALDSSKANDSSLRDFRERYLRQVKIRAEGNSYVTDKMPLNFRFAGLITAALPESKIIHVKRDPRATCWSNFKHYFASDDIDFCYSLTDVVGYFEQYESLMKFWDRCLQKKIYSLDYDTLTAHQNRETRRVIDHIGLNWNEACLSPNKNMRSVATASNIQVRQEIYRGSSLQWEKYRPFLENAFDDLP